MSRIANRFESLKAENKKALIPYIVAGDPDLDLTLVLMHEMVEAGASLIELGIPFSDPMADGPSIQLGHERALRNNTSTRDVLALVKSFREKDSLTPIVLMGYLNPFEIFGYEKFAIAASVAGVDALLVVDLPPEEATDFKAELNKKDIDLIFLIAPTTTKERIAIINKQASGFLYYVSLKGVTGAGNFDINEVEEKISEIRSISDLPITVGFGIKDGESAAQLSSFSDGVVVGSKLVDQCVLKNYDGNLDKIKVTQSITSILREMHSAMHPDL
jgi:tryptophan synthase alpha chain